MRRRIWLAAVAAVTITGTVGACTGQDTPPQASCRLLTPPPDPAAAGDPTGISLAEQGHSTLHAANFSTVTIGAILENTTDKVAYHTRVTFDALGADGTSTVQDTFHRYQVIEVPILLPKTKVPVGTTLAIKGTDATDVTITFAPSQWLPAGDATNGLAPITTTLVPAKTSTDPQGIGTITYRTRSANCTDLVSRGSSYVLRDTAGTLLGGGIGAEPQDSGCDTDENRFDNSFITAFSAVPKNANLAKTEVAALCDLSKVTDSQPSGGPLN
ncbi:hypothetical protein GCM10010435_62040 [Winogradskya consettensis]|uniref:Lipoprotein n=1 Tax=Winogradskya consettensis TaxID=113560 RepID=A0A919SS51_9ACTN|nr:hypothetical protein [Actinoplanes consettensis]GIM76073.1 hypothetical protein Aco04nite_48510 [Actinoplanes consettensis]